MKTLFIVRHGKSSWEYEGIKDIDRPLKKRGISDAYLVSEALSRKIKTPSVFVSSCANRALHTAMIFSYTFNYPLSYFKISKSLYSFSDGYLIKTVKALDNSFDSAIIFSHDHGISDFVNKFGNQVIDHVPTCGVVAIEFDAKHWKNIKDGRTLFTVFPRDCK